MLTLLMLKCINGTGFRCNIASSMVTMTSVIFCFRTVMSRIFAHLIHLISLPWTTFCGAMLKLLCIEQSNWAILSFFLGVHLNSTSFINRVFEIHKCSVI